MSICVTIYILSLSNSIDLTSKPGMVKAIVASSIIFVTLFGEYLFKNQNRFIQFDWLYSYINRYYRNIYD